MILVTGATGFVGSHVLRRAAAGGPRMRGLARRPAGTAGAELAVGDLTRPETLPPALEGVEVVVHAAAITGNLKEPYRGAYDRVNRAGTENLVRAAEAAGVRRFVLLSGLGTSPAPAGTYMATRWGMEEAVRRSLLEHVILQPSVLFGDGAEFVRALASLIRRSPVVPVLGRPGLEVQPLWVEDLVTCLLRSTEEAFAAGRTIALGGPERLTLAEVVGVVAAAMGKRRLLVPLPPAMARAPARVMTALLARPPLTPAAVELFEFDNATDVDAVQRSFGFRPRSFREHLAEHGVGG